MTQIEKEQSELGGLRVLVVEDMLLVAEEISEKLRSWGCEVIGPVPRLDRAMPLVQETPLDGALLDVNLGGEPCFPLAAALDARGVPFLFLTGYDSSAMPPEFQTVPRLRKPLVNSDLARGMTERFRRRA